MRKGNPLPPTVAPAPATCGGKNRAATEDITTNAERLWKFGTSARRAKPGIFELCQSIGNVIGVLPSTLKSKALWVYFQMYSPLKTKCLPKPCCSPAWNSLRKPGCRIVETPGEHASSGLRTALPQPTLESTRFSLNGVSSVRAYDVRNTVPVFFTVYAMPTRGSACRAIARPL